MPVKLTLRDADREFRVDSDASWLRVLAYPDGPLKRFGHHHVISHQGFTGTVTVPADPLETTFELEIAAADFGVDKAELRGIDGEEFAGEVPQKDVDGTRANMEGERLLNVAEHATIRIHARAIQGEHARRHYRYVRFHCRRRKHSVFSCNS